MAGEKTVAEQLALEQRHISVSEFFTKNRHLLGFDNSRKALLTTIKEAVDNSLDACQEMKVLPEIIVEVQDLGNDRLKVVVEDNGPGIIKEQIPNIFARLLYGSKFHKLTQNRGQQGIGISASVLYGQLTTGKPTKITSKISSKRPAHYYELNIDTKKNEPKILKDEVVQWQKDHGTKVEIELEGSYQKGRQSVDEYLKQTAIVNPHLHLIYKNPEKQKIIFPRATKELPVDPKEIKPHPYGVELGILLNMLHDTKAKNLSGFLSNDFSRVSAKTAKDILQKANLSEKIKPQTVTTEQADKLMKAMGETKIMAPPTNCLSPIGEELILKGLQKEIEAEFYSSITRPPAVYRGNPFVIECCTGDTKLILEDGSTMTIKKYVEENHLDKKIFSMNQDFKVTPSKVFMVHKFMNKHKILRITTRTGRQLKLTDNNEVPIIENGILIWRKASDVMAGEFIAVPRRFNIIGKIPDLLDLLDPKIVKVVDTKLVTELLGKLKDKYDSYKVAATKLGIEYNTFKAYKRKKRNPTRPTMFILKSISNDLNLNFEDIKKRIKYIRIVDNRFTNPIKVNLPEINEDLLYILGLLCSDGYISKKCISFVNTDQSLHKTYSKITYSLFGLKTRRSQKASTLCNKTLYHILRKMREVLPTLPDNLITSWLKGVADGDGHPKLNYETMNLEGIHIATARRDNAEIVQTMLLRLGIISKIEKRKPSKYYGRISGRIVRTKKVKYDIVIEDIANMKRFSSIIGFRQTERANKLLKALFREERNKSDVVPLGRLLKLFRQENNLYQYELGFSDQTIRQVEKGNQNLTRAHLQETVVNSSYGGKVLSKLKLLAFSDLLWDKIINIELVPHEEYVYDLTVETGNFVADNIIMHNCGIAYGGKLSADDLVRILRFANRVPLLYQQSACASTRSIVTTAWKNYGLSQSKSALPSGPAIILLHIASVWVPFTSESKEAVAHYPEIIKEMKLALQECGRKLASYIRKTVKARQQQERINLFEKYIPELASSLADLSGAKKSEIQASLEKTLKKGMKDLLAQLKEVKNG